MLIMGGTALQGGLPGNPPAYAPDYEIIMLSLHVSPGEWSSPDVAGHPPPPCSAFTLTQVDERRAALFGGYSGSRALSDLFVVELRQHTVVSVILYWLIFVILKLQR